MKNKYVVVYWTEAAHTEAKPYDAILLINLTSGKMQSLNLTEHPYRPTYVKSKLGWSRPKKHVWTLKGLKAFDSQVTILQTWSEGV